MSKFKERAEELKGLQQRLKDTQPADVIPSQSTAVPAKIAPSPYQQAVMDEVEIGKGSIIVKARAGSGKTKTIELCLPLIPENKYVSVVAFNKSIADELNARLDKLRRETGRPLRNFRAQTFHSTGVGMVARKLGKPVRSLNISDKKSYDLAERLFGADDFEMYGSFVVKLVGFAKGEGVGAGLAADTPDTWFQLIAHHDLQLEHEEATEDRGVELARELLRDSNVKSLTGYIDYDDMLYLPLLWNLRPFQLDFVGIDEAQDTNPVRRALAKKMVRPGGRTMWVGDQQQAIYGFTGASAEAMDLIKREFNAKELPLTICYRCSKSVVRAAQTYVPDIEYAETAPEGLVEHLDQKDALPLLDEHDAILCRNTAPLIKTAYELIAAGRGCVVLGRDIGQGLINLVKKMKAKNFNQLEEKLAKYRERETTKFMGRGEEQKAERVNDTVDCIEIVIANLPETERSVPKLISRIEALFSDSNGKLTLATVHKAKGKEWRRVAILRPDLMPSKWARQDWQQEQERNLIYVAITRAMEHLIWINPPPKGGQ